jgi:hypothetical protein
MANSFEEVEDGAEEIPLDVRRGEPKGIVAADPLRH